MKQEKKFTKEEFELAEIGSQKLFHSSLFESLPEAVAAGKIAAKKRSKEEIMDSLIAVGKAFSKAEKKG